MSDPNLPGVSSPDPQPVDDSSPLLGLQDHNNRPVDQIADVTDFSTWKASDIYKALRAADPNGTAKKAAGQWDELATAITGPGALLDDLQTYLKPLTGPDTGWTGEAQKRFAAATANIVAYAKQLSDTARSAPLYGSLNTVSTELASWLGPVQEALNHDDAGSFVNAGNEWTSPDKYAFTQDSVWRTWAQKTMLPVNVTTIIPSYSAAPSTYVNTPGSQSVWTLDDKLRTGNTADIDNSDQVAAWIKQAKLIYLNANQKNQFVTLAKTTGNYYRYYYHYIPEPPDPRNLPQINSDPGTGVDPLSTQMPPLDTPLMGSGPTMNPSDALSQLTPLVPAVPADGSLPQTTVPLSSLPLTNPTLSNPNLSTVGNVPLPTIGGGDVPTNLAGMPLPGLAGVPGGLASLTTPGAASGLGFGPPGLAGLATPRLPGLTGPSFTGLPGLTTPGTAGLPGAAGFGIPGTLGGPGAELPGLPGEGAFGPGRLGLPGEPGGTGSLPETMQAGGLGGAAAEMPAGGALAAEEAAAARGGMAPMMPMMPMGGMGGMGQDRDQAGADYLVEEFFTVPRDCAPAVIDDTWDTDRGPV